APIPVHNLVSGSVALVPRKLATIVTLTAEMLASSNAEAFVTAALTQSVGLALDAALFDSAAASAIRPAGLRYNIAARTASTATDPRSRPSAEGEQSRQVAAGGVRAGRAPRTCACEGAREGAQSNNGC